MTIRERLGRLEGVRVAYLGDGNNVCASLMVGAPSSAWSFVAATPEGYEPDRARSSVARAAAEAGGTVELVRRPARGRRAAPTSSTRTSGRAWARRRSASGACTTSPASASTTTSSRLAGAGRDRPPLPARPLRRGDHRGRALRAAVGRLGPGREPPARPEGAAGARSSPSAVLPLKDNVPTRSFPIVTVGADRATSPSGSGAHELPGLTRTSSTTATTRARRARARSPLVPAGPPGHGWRVTAFTSMFMHGELAAHRRQHALPLDLRQQRRGRDGPGALPRLLPRSPGSRRPRCRSSSSAPSTSDQAAQSITASGSCRSSAAAIERASVMSSRSRPSAVTSWPRRSHASITSRASMPAAPATRTLT